jgi:hypothetical protein
MVKDGANSPVLDNDFKILFTNTGNDTTQIVRIWIEEKCPIDEKLRCEPISRGVRARCPRSKRNYLSFYDDKSVSES